MPTPLPPALPENAGLAFVGERVLAAASLPPRLAARMLALRNPHGKPNADVLRELVSAPNAVRPGARWQVDFAAELTEPEAALYEQPFHHLERKVRPKRARWWVNPHADAALRTALARRERFLATAAAGEAPAFRWFASTLLPDSSLVAVARDDDFAHGILSARPMALWWAKFHTPHKPPAALAAFPFPWPPATTLNSLTPAQEEQRHAIARAARGHDAGQLNAAVAAAYGWPVELEEAALLDRLVALHSERVQNTGRNRLP